MNQYVAIMQTTTLGLAWEYKFSQPSNDMAIDYMSRHMHTISSYSCFMSLCIWRVDEKNTAQEYVAELEVQTSFSVKVKYASGGEIKRRV